MFDLVAHIFRQRAFSRATFGPGDRTKGVVDHIRKELIEIEAAPADLEEWADVVLLALDGAWRAADAMGVSRDLAPKLIADTIAAKQLKNEFRNWPDWRHAPTDKAIEHTRAPANCPFTSCTTPNLCQAGCTGRDGTGERAPTSLQPREA